MRDWVIVDNTHEAIIPAEQFELVQRILKTETRRPNDAETVALFAGFLYCGDCGSRLVRRSASYKGKRYIYYQCSGSKQNKGSCTSHNLRDEKLHNIVRNALQMQIRIVMEEAEFVESIRQAQQEPYRVRRIERQIRQLTAEKAHTQGIKEKLYGDYADEILTREDFLNYNELYSKRIEEYADMNSGRVMNLRVTIPAESRRMNVGKDVIRILGSPAYICVLQRKDRKSIAITPCAAEHPMSFKVPDRLLTDGQCRMMINGIQFIQALLEANGLAAGKDHQFKGRYDAEKNAVIISLKNGE